MSQVSVTVENVLNETNVTVENEVVSVLVTVSPEEAARAFALQAEAAAAAADVSEFNAAASAAAALASENAAELAEDNAAASASTATAQAGIATTQAGIATTQANIATTQAGNALASANAATASASAALGSQNAAAASASTATAQADISTTQAGNALASANAAAASAAAAAQVGTSTLLTGLSIGPNQAITATDSILTAFGEVQAQINARAVISGTPVAGQVAFWGSASAVAGDSGLTYNTSTGVFLIKQKNQADALRLENQANAARFFESYVLDVDAVRHEASGYQIFRVNNRDAFEVRDTYIEFKPSSFTRFFANTTEVMRVATATGNLLLNTTTDAGFRLDVNGTARVQGDLTTNLTTGSVPFIGASGVLTQNNANLFWDNVNGRLGIGTNAPSRNLNLRGSFNLETNSTTYGWKSMIQADNRTGSDPRLLIYPNHSFDGSVAIGPSTGSNLTVFPVRINGYGLITNGLAPDVPNVYGNASTSSTAFKIFLKHSEALTSASTEGFDIIKSIAQDVYDAPPALRLVTRNVQNNFITRGNRTNGIIYFTSFDGTNYLNNAYISARTVNDFTLNSGNSHLTFGTSSNQSSASERVRITDIGNILIGTTTDAGFRLDVNGTARVQGALTTNLTAGRVPFIGTAGVLSDDGALTYNSTTKVLTIGQTGNDGTIQVTRSGSGVVVGRLRGTSTGAFIGGADNINQIFFSTAGDGLSFFTYTGTGTSNAERLRIFSGSGNLLIQNGGTFTDAGFRLDVNGTARVQSTFKVGAATATNSSAVLDVESTTQGFLPPRMTTAQRNAIASPATGLVVYNTTDNRLSVYNGSAWVNIDTL